MKAKKLLSAVITAVMCLNLLAGTGFALEDQQAADTSEDGRVSGGIEWESPAGENGGSAESAAGDEDHLPDAPKSGEAAWTICVYMCGSDLESGTGAASSDLVEMLESVQMDIGESVSFPESVNLLVMTGGASAWDPEGLAAGVAGAENLNYLKPGADRVELFKITPENGMERLNDDLDSWIARDGRWSLANNMADPDTAKIFGCYAIEKYPAEHMMFSFWDHGGAFIFGCEKDENSELKGDSQILLSSADVDDIIDTFAAERGEKLDLVGFDACLMSGMEMAQVLSDSADYMLASEEVEPGPGWEYHWLYNIFREPAGGQTAADIGREIIKLYPEGFSSHDKTCGGADDIWNHVGEDTLALTDLSKIGGLIDAFDGMAAAMGAFAYNDALSDHFADLAYAISQSAGSFYQENLLDVYDFAQNVEKLYTDENSSLYDHQNAEDHRDCKALYDAAQEVSGCFTFSGEAEELLLEGTGANPIVYRGRGKQAARGGLSVFGPILSSEDVDSDSKDILKVYDEVDILDEYSRFIETLNSKKQEIGNFTGSMMVTSRVEANKLISTLRVRPRNAAVSVVDVNAQIAYTDLSTGSTYLLGETSIETANRKDMVFTHSFDDTWMALDGRFCTMNMQISDSGVAFTIPAYVKDGGKKLPALVKTKVVGLEDAGEGDTVFSILAQSYTVIPENAGEAEVANRTTMLGTEPGQQNTLTFIPVLVRDGSQMDDPAGWTEVGTEVTADEEFLFPLAFKTLASGRNNLYEARFALTDIMGQTHLSSPEPFFVITNINDFSAMPIHPQVYEAGSPATPAVHLFFGNAVLEEGVDFTVEYTGNDGIPTPGNPITAAATITDKEDPSSTRTLDFIICTADDYDRVYMNWIADILKETTHVPGNEGTEIGGTGMLLGMVSPLDEYIVHTILAEELQLEYDLCTAAERSFFTQDRVDTMRQHYSGATRITGLTNNGVTLVGGLRILSENGYLSLVNPPESGLKVTLGQPNAAQLAEWGVDGRLFTDALADARGRNGSVNTVQTYNPVFQVKESVSDLAWEIVVGNLGEGETIETLADAELARRYEAAQAQIRGIFGDVEYVQRPLRQTGESGDLQLVLKIALPSGYYENTASIYRIDGTGYKKLGEEDSLHFITENGVSCAVFETRALHEGCWFVMMAAPKPAGTGDTENTGNTGNADTDSGDSSTTYSITIPTVSGGKVTASPRSAARGETVTVTAVPASGYRLISLTAADSSGKALALTDRGGNQYTFTMPNGRVALNAVFQPIQPNGPETPWNNPFTDVSENAWHYDAVRFVHENGLMNGYGNNTFAPNANLSRAMLAQILYNREGQPAASGRIFTDVTSDAWYSAAVTWAAAQGIVSGYGNGLFGPSNHITREQLAVMLWRYAGSPVPVNQTLSFSDADAAGEYARTALCWAVEQGIMRGNGGRLAPKELATRAHAAQMLKRFIEGQT